MKTNFLLAAVLLLAGCAKDPAEIDGGKNADWGNQPALPVVTGEASFNLDAAGDYISVMGTTTPRMPNFPALTPKKGTVRGYVADLSGKPLQGAQIGIRATATGGYYSGASAKTDANGYYEITTPWGAADFYAAGYTIDYGGGRAVMSLAAADGNVDSFPSADGMIKNFVLLSYGSYSQEKVGLNPRDQTNYAGGSLYISYNVSDPDDYYIPPAYIPENAEIQVTLTPDGPGLYGENKTFTVRKKASLLNYGFTIMNIPVGRYTISAKLSNGMALHLEAVGRYAHAYPNFGLLPAEATGSAKVLFTPDLQSENLTTLPNRSNWGTLNIKVAIPE